MVIKLNPNDATAYYNLGIPFHRKGEYHCAIENYTKALNLNPNLIGVHYNRGFAYATMGEYDSALKDFNIEIEINPSDAKPYNSRGVLYLRKGEYNCAIEDFNKAIELNSNDVRFHSNRGEAWLHLQEWEKARADLALAKERGVDIVAAFHNDYASVSDFEQKNDVKLPEDIVAMLTPEKTEIEEDGTQNTAHPVDKEAEMAGEKILKDYDRAWKTLAKL